MKILAILGAGGHAKVVLDIACLSNHFNLIQVYDDAYQAGNAHPILNYSVIGNTDQLLAALQAAKSHGEFFVAIGNNMVRAIKYLNFLDRGLAPVSYLCHPMAILSPSAKIGKGSVLMAGSIVNPGATLGENIIVNTGAIIEHDNIIRDHAHIAPNVTLCGNVTVGKYTWIGAGATVIEGVSVGENCLVGAGAVVTKSIPDNTMVAGVPAKKIKQLKEVIL